MSKVLSEDVNSMVDIESIELREMCNKLLKDNETLRADLEKARAEREFVVYEYTRRDGATETESIPFADAGDCYAEMRFRAESAEVERDALAEQVKAMEEINGANFQTALRQDVKLDEACDKLTAALARVEHLEQVASGNEERVTLIAKKFSGQPYDAARLAALNEMMTLAFPRVCNACDALAAKIARADDLIRDIRAQEVDRFIECTRCGNEECLADSDVVHFVDAYLSTANESTSGTASAAGSLPGDILPRGVPARLEQVLTSTPDVVQSELARGGTRSTEGTPPARTGTADSGPYGAREFRSQLTPTPEEFWGNAEKIAEEFRALPKWKQDGATVSSPTPPAAEQRQKCDFCNAKWTIGYRDAVAVRYLCDTHRRQAGEGER